MFITLKDYLEELQKIPNPESIVVVRTVTGDRRLIPASTRFIRHSSVYLASKSGKAFYDAEDLQYFQYRSSQQWIDDMIKDFVLAELKKELDKEEFEKNTESYKEKLLESQKKSKEILEFLTEQVPLPSIEL